VTIGKPPIPTEDILKTMIGLTCLSADRWSRAKPTLPLSTTLRCQVAGRQQALDAIS